MQFQQRPNLSRIHPSPAAFDRQAEPVEMFARCRDAPGRTFGAVGTVNEAELDECFFRDGKVAQR